MYLQIFNGFPKLPRALTAGIICRCRGDLVDLGDFLSTFIKTVAKMVPVIIMLFTN